MGSMSFSQALELIKAGKRLQRVGWNGKGMCVFSVGLDAQSRWTYTDGRYDNFPCSPFIAMKIVDDCVVPWLCSQTDMLADDWQVLDA